MEIQSRPNLLDRGLRRHYNAKVYLMKRRRVLPALFRQKPYIRPEEIVSCSN